MSGSQGAYEVRVAGDLPALGCFGVPLTYQLHVGLRHTVFAGSVLVVVAAILKMFSGK